MRSNASALITESSGISECLDRLAANKRSTRPLATYRLQFNAGFRFDDARRLVGYLHAMGVSHVYSSPILRAREGSPHGYDITDHNELNPEIGHHEDFQRFVTELKNYGIGLVLDFVPNHMAGCGTNPWWRDVLANGRASDNAEFFDIDWDPLKPELHEKILLPILGDQYGAELEAGKIKLVLDDQGFHIEYYDKKLPIDPQAIPLIFEPLANEPLPPELRTVLSGLRSLPSHSSTENEPVRQRRRSIPLLTETLQELLRDPPEILRLTEPAVESISGKTGDPHSFDVLHRLLEAQVYRLANWRGSRGKVNNPGFLC